MSLHPGLLFVGAYFGGLAAHTLWPLWLPGGGGRPVAVGGALLVGAGAALLLSAIRALKRAGTPVEPHAQPKALVHTGPYRFSRNPMYLGLVLVQVGTGLLMGSVTMLVLAVALLVLLDRGVVRAEEQALRRSFGPAWDEHARRTRRWV